MILKPGDMPSFLLTFFALLNRLCEEHQKYLVVKNDYERRKAGYYGEKSINYYLSLIPDITSDFKVFHNLRLPYKDSYFQIDLLLLFPSFFIILEVKNLTGTLIFDPAHQQLLQIKSIEGVNTEKSIMDPVLQAKRQFTQFQSWLKTNKFSPLPGEFLAVLTNPNAIIKTLSNPELINERVIRSVGLSFKVEKYIQKYNDSTTNKKEWKKLSSQIQKGNVPIETNLLSLYEIDKSELLTGVQCSKCNRLGMNRCKGRWNCPQCYHTSKDAHLQALRDYSTLVSKIISIKEFCRFLKIDSIHTARRIIRSMNLPSKGNTSDRKYILP
ncbi:MAG: nuclease-related domain-containing protein [Bacillota bacterium]